MARVSSVGAPRDRVSSLSAVIRDHRMAMGNSSRRDQLLGLNSPPNGNAFDEELKEEDIWAATELTGSNSDGTGLVFSSPPETSNGNVVINSGNVETGGRRWVESGLGAISALPRNSGGVGRVTSASRMIPHMVSSANENGRKVAVMHQSAPVNVPDWSRILGRRSKDKEIGNRGSGEEEEVEDDDEEETSVERLPPHELVARSQVTTFSVFEGAGRTLKGRDLSRVRNAVLKQTGFLQ